MELPDEFDANDDGDEATLSLKLEHSSSLFREFVCLGALLGFAVDVTLVDTENGWREHVNLELSRRF